MPLGIEGRGYYTTAPLRETLSGLIDLEHCDAHRIRLTVGAVNARNGEMRYFDSRQETLGIDHVLASGALPPAFPAVRIDGDPYWDGGHVLQHADRGGARRHAPAGFGDLHGQHVESGWTGT